MKPLFATIVCALVSEARPLIQFYKLKEAYGATGFKVFGSETRCLIVTGMGKVSAAAGTAYLGGFIQSREHGIWMNVGIAGSGLRPVGENVMAHKITEASTGKTWYPSMTFDPPAVTDALTTVENTAVGILDHTLVDMEASGFYETALRFTESEWIQCYKIVSDNRDNPPEGLNPKKAFGLVEAGLAGIDDAIRRLQHLAESAGTPALNDPQFMDLVSRWPFSRYQKHRFAKLWKKSKALKLDQTWTTLDWSRFKSGNEVIGHMERTLKNIPSRIF